jgi:hypothetical protein
MPSLNNTTDGRASGYPRREYITTSAFNNDLLTYNVTRSVTGVTSGTLTPVTGGTAANCPANRILRENGRRLYKDVNAGVNTLLVGVYDSNSGLSGVIDPNSPRFAMYNGDKSVFLDNGVDPVTGLTDQGPPIYTRGTVTAGSGLSASTGIAQTATVTAASSTGQVVTYTAANSFNLGDIVTITGLSTLAFNLTNVVIASANTTSFTVTNAAIGTAVTGSTGVATSINSNLVLNENGVAICGGVYVATVTAVSGSGTVVTYTAANTFSVGDLVSVVNVTTTTAYNVTSYPIASASATQFTINNTTTGTGGVSATTIATVTKPALTVGAGGLVISNSGTSVASSTMTNITSSVDTITYTCTHAFVAGQVVTIAGAVMTTAGTDNAKVNLTNAVIATVSGTASFTVTSTGVGTVSAWVSGGVATANNTNIAPALTLSGGSVVQKTLTIARAPTAAGQPLDLTAANNFYFSTAITAGTTFSILPAAPPIGTTFSVCVVGAAFALVFPANVAIQGAVALASANTTAALVAGPKYLFTCVVVA